MLVFYFYIIGITWINDFNSKKGKMRADLHFMNVTTKSFLQKKLMSPWYKFLKLFLPVIDLIWIRT